MNRSSRLQCLTAALAVVGLGLLPGPGGAAQQTFSESTQVLAVEVPVQVVKDGEPVRGLTAADFELYDGRRKVPVTGFEVLDLAAPAPPGAVAAAAAPVPVSARRHFLLLFDLSYSEPKSILKARAASQQLVDSLHPTDLVAVATYSIQQGPQLVIGFTPDRQQIAAAIDTLGVPKLIDRAPDPLKLVLNQAFVTQNQGAPLPGKPAANGARAAKEEALLDTLATFAASTEHAERTAQTQYVLGLTRSFADLARLMASVGGRKYVVYLSEGYDSSLVAGKVASGPQSAEDEQPAQDIGDFTRITANTDATGNDDRFGNTRAQNAVEKMLESFRRSDCVIQAVDIGGLRAGNDQGTGSKGAGRESLFNMAKSTGGELFENYNDLSAAMGQMLRRTGVTYVLTFQPDVKPDGSFHSLKVELKNAPRGARVVARPGYYAPVPYKQQPVQQKLLEAASDLMSHDSGGIATAVLAAPFSLGGPQAYVPVVIEVDGPTLLAGKQDPRLPVEIYIYALDSNGTIQGFLTETIGLDLTKVEPLLRQSGLKFFGHVDLPPGTYSLRTLVRNGTTGETGLRVSELKVPAVATGEAALLPPLFQEPPGRWVPVRENPKEGKQLPYPFMLKSQPYIPASRPVLTPGQESRLVLVGYNLKPGDWKAHAQVMSADGKEIPGGAFKVIDKDTGRAQAALLATFQPPPALPPGSYSLRVTLTDGGGREETSATPFTVKGAGAQGGR